MFLLFCKACCEGFLDRIHAGRQLDGFIGVLAGEIQRPLVVVDLEVRELQAVGRGDDHHMLGLVDLAGLEQFDQRGQGNAGMRAVEHAGGIAERGRVGQFLLCGVHRQCR